MKEKKSPHAQHSSPRFVTSKVQSVLYQKYKTKTKNISATSATVKNGTIKKLTKKKTYYVRVRAYKVINGKKYYCKWSKINKVKIKK